MLGLTGALAVIGVTAGPGLAGGPSPAQLRRARLDVRRHRRSPGSGCACYHPGEGHPPVPPLGEDGRASYTAMDWAPGGEFLGHVHLIRPDLYSGQPCAADGRALRLQPGARLLPVLPLPSRRIAVSRLAAAVLATAAADRHRRGDRGLRRCRRRQCGPRSLLPGMDIRSTSDGYGSSTASVPARATACPRSAFGITAVPAPPTVSSSPPARRAREGCLRDAGCVSCPLQS